MNWNGKCNQWQQCEVGNPMKAIIEGLGQAISDGTVFFVDNVKKSVEEVMKEEKYMGSSVVDSRLGDAIYQVVMHIKGREIESCTLVLRQDLLINWLILYPGCIIRDNDNKARISEKYASELTVYIAVDDSLPKDAIKVIDAWILDSEGDIPALVKTMVSTPAPAYGVQMCASTLDIIVTILKNHYDTEVLYAGDKVLLPCGGYVMVTIDNNMDYGKIRYTNKK